MTKSRVFKILISIVLIILFIAGVVLSLALSDPNRGKYSLKESPELARNIIISTITNTQTTISEEELSGEISSIISNEVYFDLKSQDNGKFKIYMPVNYGSFILGISANVLPKLNNETDKFSFELSDAKIGNLPIPASILANKITKSEVQNFTSENNIVFTDSYIKYGTGITTIQIQIDEFEIKDENVVIKTSGHLKTTEDDVSSDVH